MPCGTGEGAWGTSEHGRGVSEGAWGVFEGARVGFEGVRGIFEGARGVFEGAHQVRAFGRGDVELAGTLVCNVDGNDAVDFLAVWLDCHWSLSVGAIEVWP